MRTLTLNRDDLFTVATDEAGRTYRVLLTTGRPPAYYLKPIEAGYRGKTIVQGQPLYPAIDDAEKDRIVDLKDRARAEASASVKPGHMQEIA